MLEFWDVVWEEGTGYGMLHAKYTRTKCVGMFKNVRRYRRCRCRSLVSTLAHRLCSAANAPARVSTRVILELAPVASNSTDATSSGPGAGVACVPLTAAALSRFQEVRTRSRAWTERPPDD
mgnify:CR=1 FL=1